MRASLAIVLRTLTLTVVVAGALMFACAAQPASMSAKSLSDLHVGKSKSELVAQKTYSATVIHAIESHARWRYAPHHASCWNHVPWRHLCNQVRARLNAQRFLYQIAEKRYKKLYAPRVSIGGLPSWLAADFSCIHRYEGAWTANTGNGYYGGLQMDYAFMSLYGAEYLALWGTADHWPIAAQMNAAARAYASGRGFGPWPNTARACGLL